jgi:hypothetical protein
VRWRTDILYYHHLSRDNRDIERRKLLSATATRSVNVIGVPTESCVVIGAPTASCIKSDLHTRTDDGLLVGELEILPH